MKTIGVFREPGNDARVSLVPQTVKKITDLLKAKVYVEKDAGLRAGFSNESYETAGAIIADHNEIFEKCDLLISVNHLYRGQELDSNKTFVGIYNMMFYRQRIDPYLKESISLFSLDMVPRTTRAQAMDVLSSMASLSGYKAVIKAAEIYGSVLPMFTTAAGTIKPAKVLVLGAGVAGLQAIATARRLGAIVEAFDVRASAGEEVRSLGAKFIEVEGARESKSAGGYAVEQTKEFLQKQKELIHDRIKQANIVISTANIPGKKAPVLIEKQSVEAMRPGSVIIDMATEQGGNCVLSKDNQMINHNGVHIIGNSSLSREMPSASSNMLSGNYFSFIQYLFENQEEMDKDPILSGCRVVSDGTIVHPAFTSQLTK